MRMQIGARHSLSQAARAFLRTEDFLRVSHQMERSGQRFPIDDDFDPVSLPNFANGSACESFGRDMSDACPGGDAAETRIGENCHMLAVRKLLERRGNLIDLLHTRAGRPTADENTTSPCAT